MTSWRVQCNKDYHYATVLTTPLQKVVKYFELPSSWLNSLANGSSCSSEVKLTNIKVEGIL